MVIVLVVIFAVTALINVTVARKKSKFICLPFFDRERKNDLWLIIYLERQIPYGGACTTPTQQPGSCVELLQCTSLVRLLQTVRDNPGDREYLRQSQCGGTIRSVHACCPTTELTTITGNKMDLLPDREICGQQGSHTNIFGGTVTDVDEFPWSVQLWYQNCECIWLVCAVMPRILQFKITI